MDPLVRVALTLQVAFARSSGLLVSLGVLAYCLARLAGLVRPIWDLAVAGGLAATLVVLGLRALGKSHRAGARPPDATLFVLLVAANQLGLLWLDPPLRGSLQPSLYLLLILVAAFARPRTALVTLGFALILETAGCLIQGMVDWQVTLLPKLGFAVVFTTVNLLVFRAEIARVRRLSRSHIESELRKMKEKARSYRLLAAPSAAMEHRASLASDEDRAMQSGVDEIRLALQFALDLLRRSLRLRTAALLWLDGTGQRARVEELSTAEDGVMPGPFDARDGILGAVISQKRPVALYGPRVGRHVPYYPATMPLGSLCGVPIMDHEQPRGALVVDRVQKDAFSDDEVELLQTTTHFILRAMENERVFFQLERAKLEQGKLYRAVDRLAAATTEAQVIEAGVNSAREFAAFDCAAVTLFDRKSLQHEIRAVSGEGMDRLVGKRFASNTSLVSMVVSNRHPLPYRGDHDPERQIIFAKGIDAPAVPSLLVLPLLVHERALGTLVLGSHRRGAFGEAVRTSLEVLASHLAVSLSNARMLRRLEELATTDGLTGLYNKRTLIELAAQKLKSAQRFGRNLSLLVFDLDHFKSVNDTHGHDMGDTVIRGFAEVLHRVKRDVDVVGRFGGEEFVLVCEQTTEQGALQLGERIRTELQAVRFSVPGGQLIVTCSVGVASFPAAGRSFEELFKSADEALYVSKRSGRNRTTLWNPKTVVAA